jgi:hypothetical protein
MLRLFRRPKIQAAGFAGLVRGYLFLWRLAFRRFLYLCFDIFWRRFFLMDPTVLLLV